MFQLFAYLRMLSEEAAESAEIENGGQPNPAFEAIRERKRAVDAVLIKARNGEAGKITKEEREKYCSIESAKVKFCREVKDVEDWEYVDLPESLVEAGEGDARLTDMLLAWVTPTPSFIQEIIEVIDYCYGCIRDLGYMPDKMIPDDMTDEQIVLVMSELDDELDKEFGPWGFRAGFKGPTKFGNLDLDDMRTIVALIQKVLHKTDAYNKAIVPDVDYASFTEG